MSDEEFWITAFYYALPELPAEGGSQHESVLANRAAKLADEALTEYRRRFPIKPRSRESQEDMFESVV